MSLLLLILVYGQLSYSESSSGALKSNLIIRVAKDGSSTIENQEVVEILSESARTAVTSKSITINANDTILLNAEAAIEKNGVRGAFFKPKILYSKLSDANGGVANLVKCSFEINQLQVGDKFYFNYELKQKPFIRNSFFWKSSVSSPNVADEEFTKIISDLPLFFMKYDLLGIADFKQYQSEGKYILEISPSKMATSLQDKKSGGAAFIVSTTKAWSSINLAFSPEYERKISEKLPEAFATIVKQAKAMKSPKEQIEISARLLSKIIAYYGDWSSQYKSFYPKGHQKVVQEGKGDCKDFSTSLASILRQLGFSAFPALTFRTKVALSQNTLKKISEIANPSLFDHVIVWAKDKTGKIWWIDPTNPIVIADVVSNDILGNFALVLDSKSNLDWLPDVNPELFKETMDQVVQINSDNSVSFRGNWNIGLSTFNTIGMVEKQAGADVVKKLVGVMVNPYAPDFISKLTKSQSNESVSYQFEGNSTKLVFENLQKGKSIKVGFPTGLLLLKLNQGEVLDLGSPARFKNKIRISGVQVVDPVAHSCFGLSKWMNFKRTVENIGNDVEVVEDLEVLARRMPKLPDLKNGNKSKSSAVRSNDEDWIESSGIIKKIASCFKKSELILSLNPKSRTKAEIDFEKLMGPPMDKMTLQDALELQNLSMYEEVNLKNYLFYSKRLERNAGDLDARLGRSKAILGLGERTLPSRSYLRESLKEVQVGLKNIVLADKSEFYKAEIELLTKLGDHGLAMQEFLKAYKEYPHSVFTYLAGVDVNRAQDKKKDAESWLNLALAKARSEVELNQSYAAAVEYSASIGNFQESIVYMGKRIGLARPGAKGQALYETGKLYLAMGDFQNAIEYEKKALNEMDSYDVRKALAEALLKKAQSLSMQASKSIPKSRAPASTKSYDEPLILESLKYDPNNKEALMVISKLYLDRYRISQDKSFLSRGMGYLSKIQMTEWDEDLTILLSDYKKLQQSAEKNPR